MLITSRQGVFETNSSSVHSLVINKRKDIEAKPETISKIRLGDFNSEGVLLKSPEDKLSYLWTAITALKEDRDWWYWRFIDVLGLNESIDFETPEDIKRANEELDDYLDNTHKYIPENRWPYDYRWWGIDHNWNLPALLKSMKNDKLLFEFIYGDSSVAVAADWDIERVSKSQNLDWENIDDDVLFGYGETNNRNSYIYIKGE